MQRRARNISSASARSIPEKVIKGGVDRGEMAWDGRSIGDVNWIVDAENLGSQARVCQGSRHQPGETRLTDPEGSARQGVETNESVSGRVCELVTNCREPV